MAVGTGREAVLTVGLARGVGGVGGARLSIDVELRGGGHDGTKARPQPLVT